MPGHDVPVPTLDIGEPLAKAFQATIGAAGDLFLAATQVGTITRTDLAQLDVMLPSRIAANGRERDLYESLLLTGAQGEKSRANSRSHILHLVLRIAREKGSSVRAETLRWSLYASQCNAIATFAGVGKEEDWQRLLGPCTRQMTYCTFATRLSSSSLSTYSEVRPPA